MQIEYKRLEEIKPYKNNPRINDDAVPAVAQSIEEFGFKVPIVLDKNNVIITQHTRYKAAQQIGLNSVPVIVADDLTERQAKAFRIADNKVSDFSIFDNKKLLEELDGLDDIFTGFDPSEIFDNVLDEDETGVVDENDAGVQYEIVFKSTNEDKIKAIAAQWELMNNDG